VLVTPPGFDGVAGRVTEVLAWLPPWTAGAAWVVAERAGVALPAAGVSASAGAAKPSSVAVRSSEWR
jgi:hypothetical protein